MAFYVVRFTAAAPRDTPQVVAVPRAWYRGGCVAYPGNYADGVGRAREGTPPLLVQYTADILHCRDTWHEAQSLVKYYLEQRIQQLQLELESIASRLTNVADGDSNVRQEAVSKPDTQVEQQRPLATSNNNARQPISTYNATPRLYSSSSNNAISLSSSSSYNTSPRQSSFSSNDTIPKLSSSSSNNAIPIISSSNDAIPRLSSSSCNNARSRLSSSSSNDTIPSLSSSSSSDARPSLSPSSFYDARPRAPTPTINNYARPYSSNDNECPRPLSTSQIVPWFRSTNNEPCSSSYNAIPRPSSSFSNNNVSPRQSSFTFNSSARERQISATSITEATLELPPIILQGSTNNCTNCKNRRAHETASSKDGNEEEIPKKRQKSDFLTATEIKALRILDPVSRNKKFSMKERMSIQRTLRHKYKTPRSGLIEIVADTGIYMDKDVYLNNFDDKNKIVCSHVVPVMLKEVLSDEALNTSNDEVLNEYVLESVIAGVRRVYKDNEQEPVKDSYVKKLIKKELHLLMLDRICVANRDRFSGAQEFIDWFSTFIKK